MLSIFPALIALVSIVGLVGDPQTITKPLTDIVTSIGPASAADDVQGADQRHHQTQRHRRDPADRGHRGRPLDGLGLRGAFMRASNAIYEVEEGRSIIKLRPLQMLVTLRAGPAARGGPGRRWSSPGPWRKQVGAAIGIGDTAVTSGTSPSGRCCLVVSCSCSRSCTTPRRTRSCPGFKWVTPGSLLALVVWLIASAGFAFYVANFGSYNKTYGALGGVIVFLVWLWITNVAILLGAELNAERERSREMENGVPGAERELQLAHRSEPKPKKRARTA